MKKLTLADLPPLAERRRDDYLTAVEVSAYLVLETSTVEKWRHPSRGRKASGPPYIRMGDGPKAPVRYPVGEFLDWLAARPGSANLSMPDRGGQAPAQAA